jgi:serine phosphatase RsbU (regulator of sigma subunit)/PAS domain-containing protein
VQESLDPAWLDREVEEARGRFAELRRALAVPDVEYGALLEAAFAELELAEETLAAAQAVLAEQSGQAAGPDSERRLLRTLFQDLPVAVFLLDRDGTVRRANRQAGALLGTESGYATGRPLAMFVELRRRAAFRTHVSGVARTGKPRTLRAQLLGEPPTDVVLTLSRLDIRGGAAPLIVAVAGPLATTRPSQPQPSAPIGSDADRALAAANLRLDVLSAATKQMLADDTFSEAVATRRCARLLAETVADWVIVDMIKDGALHRQVVIGPGSERARQAMHLIEELDPAPETVIGQVQASGQARLLAHLDDQDALGHTPDGVSITALLRVRSLVAVPLQDEGGVCGVLTAIRTPRRASFDLLDLALVEEIGAHLGLAIKADRLFRRRSSVADALQASLLPRALPSVPGAELATAYLAATRGIEVGGDFYDVFDSPNGWTLVLGDVCGKGEEAAAITAAARHAFRILGHWNPKPGEVLRQANEWLVGQPESDRFVTAIVVHVERGGRIMNAVTATAGHPPLVVVRSGGTIRTAAGGGLPIGLFEDAEPAVEEFEFEPGDTAMLYSDGVLEARSPTGELFGTDRLADTVSMLADEPVGLLVAGLESALADFTGGDLRDDVSILALRVNPLPEV